MIQGNKEIIQVKEKKLRQPKIILGNLNENETRQNVRSKFKANGNEFKAGLSVALHHDAR